MSPPPLLHSAYSPSPLVLFTRLILRTRTDEKGVPHVPTVPAGERPVIDDLGIHHDLDIHIEERNDLKIFKLIVAKLAQLLVISLRVGDLQQVFPHLVNFIGLEPVRYTLPG